MRSMQSDLALRGSGYLLGAGHDGGRRGARLWVTPAGNGPPFYMHTGYYRMGLSVRLRVGCWGFRLVISVPGSDAQVANANPLFRAMARFAMRQASLMTANSADLRDGVAALDPAVLNKFDLIIYGTDPKALKPDQTGVAGLRAELQLAPDTFTVLCVGRMVYKKGFDTLIRALATTTTA